MTPRPATNRTPARTLRQRAQDAALDALPRLALLRLVRSRLDAAIPLDFDPTDLREVARTAAEAVIEEALPPGPEREEGLRIVRNNITSQWLGQTAKAGFQA